MSDTTCASCGLPGHRYGRNEGMERYDPMACINQLRGKFESLASEENIERVVRALEAVGPDQELEVYARQAVAALTEEDEE